MKDTIVPVLLGCDLNCYNVARAFHEAYNVKSYAFGRYAIGATKNSRIITFKQINNFDDPQTFVYMLNAFSAQHERDSLILIACTDEYASLIVHNKDELKGFTIPYTTPEIFDDITSKAKFHDYCLKYNIPCPDTVIYNKGDKLEIPFSYPVIVKPSSSIEYWKHPFDGMKKVYRAKSFEEAEKIIGDIYAAGYDKEIIIQDMIPGDDSHMYTMTAYSDKAGMVRMMCLGHVLLEEHTPKGLGNHAAIITEENDRLAVRLKNFLEGVGFVGFSNFDIKFDERDHSYKVFEVNCRQGRSNYYVTASGNNIARCIVEERLIGTAYSGCHINRSKIYWRYIPDKIVYKYCSPEISAQVKELIRADEAYNSLRYPYDLKGNLKRSLWVRIHERRHIRKFAEYYHPEEQ